MEFKSLDFPARKKVACLNPTGCTPLYSVFEYAERFYGFFLMVGVPHFHVLFVNKAEPLCD